MSVYTPVSLAEVQHFAQQYDLTIQRIEPIQGGVENTNYFIYVDDDSAQQYVLTIFEHVGEQHLNELIPILHHLQHNGIHVPAPLLARDGQAIHRLANKPAQIAPRLHGQTATATLGQIQQIANAQARMHQTLQQQQFQHAKKTFPQEWSVLIPAVKPLFQADELQLLESAVQHYQQVRQRYPNRTQSLIHADLFQDNCLFIDDELQGILDFSELHYDDVLYDIAITINDFCSQADGRLDDEKYQTYLQCYQHIRPLTDDELQALPAYLAMLACHFWMTRQLALHRNQQNGWTGEDILQKDPNEMKQKVIQRLALLA